MLPTRLSRAALEKLLQSEPFTGWLEGFRDNFSMAAEGDNALLEARERWRRARMEVELTQQAAADLFFEAEAVDRRLAELRGRLATWENDAVGLLQAYEAQRSRASEAWQLLDAADLGEEGGGTEETAESQRAAKGRYEAAVTERDRLWAAVEEALLRSELLGLVSGETEAEGVGIRRAVGEGFERAAERKGALPSLEEALHAAEGHAKEAHLSVEECLRLAETAFGCAAGHRHLYWLDEEEPRRAWVFDLRASAPGADVGQALDSLNLRRRVTWAPSSR